MTDFLNNDTTKPHLNWNNKLQTKKLQKKKRQLGLKQQKKLRLVGYTDEVV